MRTFFILMLAILLVAGQAAAWQFINEDTAGTSSVKIPLYAVTAIIAGAGPAHSVQVKNTGSGTLTVSMHRYTGTAWVAQHPNAAVSVGQAFYAVSDSVFTLGPDDMISILHQPSQTGVHALYITRPSATTYKVAYE